MKPLLSSPEEEYVTHLEKTKNKLDTIYPSYEKTLKRVLGFEDSNLAAVLQRMVYLHDIGKLTKRWQDNVGAGKRLPAHAPIGAAYIWKELFDGLREPICFAVTIHHSDRGLLGDNIEKPDVQAINDGIVDYSTAQIVWDERVSGLDPEYFPSDLYGLGLNDLREMARGLRLWAKGCGLLDQHVRRVQAMLLHHILKLCDISAASERKEFRESDQDFFGGWLMVEHIMDYVNSFDEQRLPGGK
jgi:hypothetical protein